MVEQQQGAGAAPQLEQGNDGPPPTGGRCHRDPAGNRGGSGTAPTGRDAPTHAPGQLTDPLGGHLSRLAWKRWPPGHPIAPPEMKNELHPIEALILAVLLVITAAYQLAVSLLALVLALLPQRPQDAPAAMPEPAAVAEAAPPAPPAVAPLLAELEARTVRELRVIAGTASKRRRKAELVHLAGLAMAC